MDETETCNLPYYYNDIDRNKSETILRSINRPGCFLIRQHENSSSISTSSIKSPYALSIVTPSLEIFRLYNGNIPVAIKTCSISIDENESNILRERRIMMNIVHRYLIQFYGLCHLDNKLCLITEYIRNGSLLFLATTR
ncbi:unnamed protein product [Rotaria socialis]|uniref:SH2 domain-containing protein n=1 Tax=Rotaria socialis TaxID=392032 RepID=A0A818LRH2_9BILA|nr:unnamed protein product [Rotaria socialis]CAF3753325.1 unnamed protein product [Rotaria socialis]